MAIFERQNMMNAARPGQRDASQAWSCDGSSGEKLITKAIGRDRRRRVVDRRCKAKLRKVIALMTERSPKLRVLLGVNVNQQAELELLTDF